MWKSSSHTTTDPYFGLIRHADYSVLPSSLKLVPHSSRHNGNSLACRVGGFTQFYLPPDSGDVPVVTLTEADMYSFHLIDTRIIKGRVDLSQLLQISCSKVIGDDFE